MVVAKILLVMLSSVCLHVFNTLVGSKRIRVDHYQIHAEEQFEIVYSH
jgi:hypothetical protein